MAAGVASTIAAAVHLLIVWGGPSWYRLFGAGEDMANAAAAGSPMPTLVTMGIAAVLATWAAYAFSGAGLLPRLPLLRLGLKLIAAIYLLRGVAVLPALVLLPASEHWFWIWTSAISFGFGFCYLLGGMQLARADTPMANG